MQRRPIVKIKPVRGSGRLRAVVRFVGPAERVIERTYEVEIPAGKREQEALKARLRRTVGRELTDASARFREGVATESDLVLLLSYNVVRDVEVGSGAGAAVVPIAGGLTVGQAVEGYYRTEMPSRKSATQDQREGTLGRFLKFLEMGRGGGLGRATPVGEAFRSGVLQAFREWRTGRIAESKVKTTGARAHNEDRKAL